MLNRNISTVYIYNSCASTNCNNINLKERTVLILFNEVSPAPQVLRRIQLNHNLGNGYSPVEDHVYSKCGLSSTK